MNKHTAQWGNGTWMRVPLFTFFVDAIIHDTRMAQKPKKLLLVCQRIWCIVRMEYTTAQSRNHTRKCPIEPNTTFSMVNSDNTRWSPTTLPCKRHPYTMWLSCGWAFSTIILLVVLPLCHTRCMFSHVNLALKLRVADHPKTIFSEIADVYCSVFPSFDCTLQCITKYYVWFNGDRVSEEVPTSGFASTVDHRPTIGAPKLDIFRSTIFLKKLDDRGMSERVDYLRIKWHNLGRGHPSQNGWAEQNYRLLSTKENV